MKTLRFKIGPDEVIADHPGIAECADILRRGGLVAIPTETVYGLAANALSADAVAQVFKAKDRPAWDPLIVHVANLEMIPRVAADFPERARRLANTFWPGPLTLLLNKSSLIPSNVTAGRPTVAVRMPAHAVAHAVIAAADLPLAAPSANRFGRTSPTTAEHVLADLDGRIDAILDAGPTNIGVESTVIDPLRMPALVLRPGGITREQLEAVIGPVEIYEAPPQQKPEALASPGLAARHYAPQARMILVDGAREAFLAAVAEEVRQQGQSGEYVGAMTPEEWLDSESLARGGIVIFDWGTWGDWAQLAHNLFAGLRYLDKPGVGVIVCPLPPEQGIGFALRDRLLRAAR